MDDDDLYKEISDITGIESRNETADLDNFSKNFDADESFYQNFVPILQQISDILESDNKGDLIDQLTDAFKQLHNFFKDYEIPVSQPILESHIFYYLYDVLQNSPVEAYLLKSAALNVCCDLTRGDPIYSKELINQQIIPTIFSLLRQYFDNNLIRKSLIILKNILFSFDESKDLLMDRDVIFILDLLSKSDDPAQIRYFTGFLQAYTKNKEFKTIVMFENIKFSLNYIIDSGETPK